MDMPVALRRSAETHADASCVPAALWAHLCGAAPALLRRAPPADDPSRWVSHRIGERAYRVAQPITFTPYAAARPCSARCRFCSETLRPREGGRAASALRPQDDYFDALRDALAQLRGLPLSYSLSGLETTDDPAWCLSMLRTLDAAAHEGVPVVERVLYSNGAGFAHPQGEALLEAFAAFGTSWVELSRHHPDERANDAIMRFRADEPIARNEAFERIARQLSSRQPLRMVCIVQRGGIDDAGGVEAYVAWARRLGAETVIFREFSRLGDGYRDTGSRRYIDATRVAIDDLIADCAAAPSWPAWTPLAVTDGYYFWNLRMRHPDGVEVVFESSDYTAMHRRHASGDLYKLVFHANGRLCAGWSPDRDVLWSADDA